MAPKPSPCSVSLLETRWTFMAGQSQGPTVEITSAPPCHFPQQPGEGQEMQKSRRCGIFWLCFSWWKLTRWPKPMLMETLWLPRTKSATGTPFTQLAWGDNLACDQSMWPSQGMETQHSRTREGNKPTWALKKWLFTFSVCLEVEKAGNILRCFNKWGVEDLAT